jgi:uncharacterized membrane protein
MTYLALKLAHLLGATLLLGTGLGIAFFTWFGVRESMRTGRIELLRGVLRGTVIADTVFTATAAVLQPLTGLALYAMVGLPWRNPWLWMVLGAYVFVGLCWLPVVALQIRLRDTALKATTIAELPPRFHADFRRWMALGWPGFAGVMALYALMVFRASWWSGR